MSVVINETLDRRLFFDDSGAVKPDWKQIYIALDAKFAGSTRQAGWQEVALQWLKYLQESFGGAYSIEGSPNFLLLSDVPKDRRKSTLSFCEKALEKIEGRLGDARWKSKLGPHVIMLFENPELYYSYIAGFYSDGEHALSSGVFLNRGYAHIAMPVMPYGMANTFVHELTHNCLAHLRIPKWLNEGMARTCERLICGSYRQIIDGELAVQHHEFWTSERLQTFWWGPIFDDGEASELSYSLAEILIELAAQERKDFPGFLTHANYKDAGITASNEYLGKSLGKLAGIFLGPGDWEPTRPDNAQAA